MQEHPQFEKGNQKSVKNHIPQRECDSFSNGYLIRELNGSAHGTLNMTQCFA